MKDPVIRPLRDAAEAHTCAAFMTAIDPWLTLGTTPEAIVRAMTNPARETHIAAQEPDGPAVGVLVLHLDGLLHGYIQLLAVHPSAQGHGLGARLVRFAEERIFPERPNVFLCVSSFNHRAQKFYQRLGYTRVGELPDHIIKGHSELLLRKSKGPLTGYSPR